MQRLLWHGPSLPPELIENLWQNPDSLVQSGTVLKGGDRCTVVKIERGGRPMILKRYNRMGSVHTGIHWLLRSRARWCWVNGRRLMAAGILTPKPLACLDERRAGLLQMGSYLLLEFVPGRSLGELVADGKLTKEQLRDFAQQFATIWQALGQLRVGHGDMKASNFIVDQKNKMWLIDLDGLRVHRSRTLLHRERRIDLVRFMQNWTERPEIAAIFRARIGTG